MGDRTNQPTAELTRRRRSGESQLPTLAPL